MMRVSEIFGPTLQGEGAMAGARTLFVRLGGCDFRCVWCDSLYAVLPEHRPSWEKLEVEDVVMKCLALAEPARCPWVTLSGGNPALAADGGALVLALQAAGYRVALETQGSIAAPWLSALDHVCLSPKPPSSGMVMDEAEFARILGALAAHPFLCVKIVVFDEADLVWADDFVARNVPPEVALFLSAGTSQGYDDDTTSRAIIGRTRWLAQCANSPALVRARILPQLHVLLWGTQRGK